MERLKFSRPKKHIITMLFLCLMLILGIGRAMAADYYVSPNGSYSGQGTQAQPLSIDGALARVTGGDTINFLDGTYNVSSNGINIIMPNNTDYITFRSVNKHGAKIVSTGRNGFYVTADYIKIIDFDITCTSSQFPYTFTGNGWAGTQGYEFGNGIAGSGNKYFVVKGNYVHDCTGGGIQSSYGDQILVEDNITARNAFWSPYACSGISFYQPEKLTLPWESLPGHTGYHIVIRNNTAYENENKVPFEKGGTTEITDGNGIILDDFQQSQKSSNQVNFDYQTLIENNVCYDNGGRGIELNRADYVTVRNNTCYNNSLTASLGSRAEIYCHYSFNSVFYNNIAYAGAASTQYTFYEDFLSSARGSNLYYNNITYNGSIRLQRSSSIIDSQTGNKIGVNPLFVSLDRLNSTDFLMPQISSPAVDGGISYATFGIPADDRNYLLRPQGNVVDIGAYELVLPTYPLGVPLEDFTDGITGWNKNSGGRGTVNLSHSNGALLVQYDNPVGGWWYAYKNFNADWSGFEAISFDIKSLGIQSSFRIFLVEQGTSNNTDGEYWTYTITPTSGWTTAVIPFQTFAANISQPANADNNGKLDLNKIRAIWIQCLNTNVTDTLLFDNIKLHKSSAFEIMGYTFTYTAGNIIKCDIDFLNTTGSSVICTAALAFYEDNVLKNCRVFPMNNILSGNTALTDLLIPISGAGAGSYKLKVFVFDDVLNIKPLGDFGIREYIYVDAFTNTEK